MRADALGRLGEDVALAYFRMQGYECRDRRWRRGGGEIDLVVGRGDTTVFVEIKTRGAGSWGRARESVHPRQLRRLRRLAGRWCAEHRHGSQLRLDVVAIDLPPGGRGLVLEHFPGVG